MKKKASIPQVLLWVLIAALLISIVFNLVQHNQASASSLTLKGAYSTDAAGTNGTYFDANGHFCLYTQSQRLLEEGNYEKYGEDLNRLESTSGSESSVLLAADGVYYSSADGTLELYSRFNDVPMFVGDWSNEWDRWPDGPYDLNAHEIG